MFPRRATQAAGDTRPGDRTFGTSIDRCVLVSLCVMSIRHVLADQQIVAELTGRGIAVLIVSALGCPRHVRRMLHTGVAGVVAKSDSMDALRDAVSAALAGQKWMCPVLAQALVINRDVDRLNLSDKELEALRLYACGLKLDSVARRIGDGAQHCQAVHRPRPR